MRGGDDGAEIAHNRHMPSPSANKADAAPLAALLERETACLQRCLADVAAVDGVLVDATGLAPPPAPHLWRHLRCERDVGVVMPGGVLPVATGDAEVVVLRHALDVAPRPRALLAEALRVLAPGGVLLIAGMRSWSAWRPWLAYQTRHGAPGWRAQALGRYAPDFLAAGVVVERVERFGSAWPGRRGADGGPLAAAYLLRARKQRSAPTAVGLDLAASRTFRRLPDLAGAARRMRA